MNKYSSENNPLRPTKLSLGKESLEFLIRSRPKDQIPERNKIWRRYSRRFQSRLFKSYLRIFITFAAIALAISDVFAESTEVVGRDLSFFNHISGCCENRT